MPLIYNGVTVEKVIYNGTELDAVVYNGVTVFESKPQLSTPQSVTAEGTVVSWDEVENATSYEVLADGTGIGTVKNATIINFTVNETSYQAEDGMTWGLWVESGYNTDGFVVGQYDQITKATSPSLGIITPGSDSSRWESTTDVILKNTNYVIGYLK